MQELFKKFSVAYLAGALGGICLALVFWLFAHWKGFQSFSPSFIAAGLNWSYLAPLVLKGSLWALLIVPFGAALKIRGAAFGLILSLLPSLYVLIYQYPKEHHGLSPFTQAPQHAVLILVGYAVWGLVAGGIYGGQYK